MLELINKLERFAEETPSKIAYTIDGESITYSELFARLSITEICSKGKGLPRLCSSVTSR